MLNESRANFRFYSISCSAFAIFVLEFCLDWKTKIVQSTFTAEEGLELLAYSDLDDNDFDSQDSEVEFVGQLQDEDDHVLVLLERTRQKLYR